jgi:ABC-2 type transport system ATP-binding protein
MLYNITRALKMSSDDLVIVVSGLGKSYGRIYVLRGVSFSVRRGTIVSILGPNGAGKTTLLRILSGTLFFDEGSVLVLGYDASKNPVEIREALGFVPENNMLFPELTVTDNLRLAGSLRGLYGRKLDEAVDKVMSLLGLHDYSGRKYGVLSRGLKRRCDIAAALVHDPPLLLLDEPTAGLDIFSAYRLREFLAGLRASGKTILLSTHNITEAMTLSDKVVVLDKGRVKALGTPSSLRRMVGGLKELLVEVDGDVSKLSQGLSSLLSIHVLGRNRVRVTIMDPVEDVRRVLDTVSSLGLEVKDIQVRDLEWEEVVFKLLEERCVETCPLASVCSR